MLAQYMPNHSGRIRAAALHAGHNQHAPYQPLTSLAVPTTALSTNRECGSAEGRGVRPTDTIYSARRDVGGEKTKSGWPYG